MKMVWQKEVNLTFTSYLACKIKKVVFLLFLLFKLLSSSRILFSYDIHLSLASNITLETPAWFLVGKKSYLLSALASMDSNWKHDTFTRNIWHGINREKNVLNNNSVSTCIDNSNITKTVGAVNYSKVLADYSKEAAGNIRKANEARDEHRYLRDNFLSDPQTVANSGLYVQIANEEINENEVDLKNNIFKAFGEENEWANSGSNKEENTSQKSERIIISDKQSPTKTEDLIKDKPNSDTVKVLVTTDTGYSRFDQSLSLTLPLNMTVNELKHLIQEKLPGKPPIGLQNLSLGNHTIEDNSVTLLSLAYDTFDMFHTDKDTMKKKQGPDYSDKKRRIVLPFVLKTCIPFTGKLNDQAFMNYKYLSREEKIEYLADYFVAFKGISELLTQSEVMLLLHNFQAPRNAERIGDLSYFVQGSGKNFVEHLSLFPRENNERIQEKIERVRNLISSLVGLNEDIYFSRKKQDGVDNIDSSINKTTDANSNDKNPFSLDVGNSPTFEELILRKSPYFFARLFNYVNFQMNVDWNFSFKLTLLLLYLSRTVSDDVRVTRAFLLMIPIIYLHQSRFLRVVRKLFWHTMPESSRIFKELSTFLPAPYQVFVGLDQVEFLNQLYHKNKDTLTLLET